MPGTEQLTIILPSDMADMVRSAVATGDYASASEVAREALGDWTTKRARQLQELAVLKGDIGKGLADMAEGRIRELDTARIVERGRGLLAARSPSA